MMNLPEEFVQRVKRVWGEQGEQWIERFPEILAHCVFDWGLTQVSLLKDLSYNFVASAETPIGEPVILKIGVPNPELVSEVEALRAFGGRGCVRLLAYDPNLSALLIERLVPGTMLHHLENNRQESEIAAELMAQLCVPPPKNHAFPSVIDWTRAFDRVRNGYQAETYGLPVKMIETAQQLASQLSRTTEEEFLLHGDLHHFNILYDQSRGWTAIDPKGVVGDRAYQAARFFSNPIPEFLTHPDPILVTNERAEIVSDHLKVDHQRVLEWAYVDCILGACWSIEEGDREGVGYFVQCAEIILRILGK